MNLIQSFKMAWRSIWGKKGRSFLTILSIFIGIAAVMTIVSVMEGMKAFTREQYAALGSNKITVNIYSWNWDEDGNNHATDYFPALYDYCNGLKEYVEGITPNGWANNATVVYGTKSTANMEWKYDETTYQVISAPPNQYYGSDQYAVCNNLQIAKGRDIAYLDLTNYNQVCTMGAQAAKVFFGSANPVGQTVQVNGQNFTVAGVYKPRITGEGADVQTDNFIVYPYTLTRVLGGETITEFVVKARDSAAMNEAISRLGGFLKGLVKEGSGGYNVYSENQWQESENEYLTMLSLVLGGIAAISLIVGGIGIMNIMLVTVTERTREIGIRRAIGAPRNSIVAQFLIEAGMLCGMGGIVGILVGTGGCMVVGRLMFHRTLYPTLWVTLAAFALSVSLGLLFGSYPAAKASRLQPVEALRAE